MTCNSTQEEQPSIGTERPVRKVSRIPISSWLIGPLLLCALFVVPKAWTQEDMLAVFGTVKLEENNKKLEGVRVVVYQDDVEFDVITTDVKGGYDFELPLRHAYVFSFELEGHSNKRIAVDASGIPMDVKGARNMDLDMSMMELPSGFDTSIFEDLYGRGEYSADENTVIFDSNYTVRMRNKVQAELARLERMAGQMEEMREQFDEFVLKGDRSKSSREWQKAVDFYDSALALFPDESDVIAKRADAQRELDIANAANADEAAFQALLDDAADALKRDRLDEARKGFEDAEDMRPDAPEPRDGLKRVDDRERELANSAEADEEYNELIEDGDIYFEREQWDRAIDKFAEASALKPNEAYPKNRMEEAQTRQADVAAQQADLIARTIEYEGLIDEANLLFREDNYPEALVKYEAAGSVLPAERFWQQRAEACRERMAEADRKDEGRKARDDEEAARAEAEAAERDRRNRYDAANDLADAFFRDEDYAAAAAKYSEASEIYPDERYPKQRLAEAEKRLERAAQEVSSDVADNGRRASNADSFEASNAAAEAAESALDDAAADERASREAAEAAARSEAERVEEVYDATIAAGDAAFDRSDWNEARRSYEEALEWKPNDRYAKSRLERIEREMNRDSESPEEGPSTGPSQAELAQQRAQQERDEARANEQLARDAASLNAQRLSEEADRRAEAEAARKEKAERERQRALQLASKMNGNERDEVEDYYKAALESEAQARMMEVEAKKQAQADLVNDAQSRASQRIERELNEQSDLLRQQQATAEAGIRAQEERRAEHENRQEDYSENQVIARQNGESLIQQGAQEAKAKARWRDRLQYRRSGDYMLNVQDVEYKRRSFRDLLTGLNRAAADRRSEAQAVVENTSRKYRRLGADANARAQERWLAARRKEKQNAQLLLKREQEARQRAYNEQVAASSNMREIGPRDPEDYKLAEADADVAKGVHEQSYDIPNGLVIERTVRTGNLVLRYRKVVTKTGVYYFRGDRSITADTWSRETTVIMD